MVILVDIGGTKTRVAVSADRVTISGKETFDTPGNPKDALERIRTTVRKLYKGEPLEMAIIGIAGVCSPDRTTIVRAPNLPKWENIFTVSLASQALGVPVYFENDAALGALGEATTGAGKDCAIMAYVTVGTGVGGARIVNKIIDQTYFGFEIGQQLVSFKGEVQLLEKVLSGSALEKRYGTSSKNIKDENQWNEIAGIFADGLYNTILHWSPECVIQSVGTGVGGARIVNKIIDQTYFGFEIGQQLVSFKGEVQLLEKVLSGSALEKRYGTSSKNIKDEKIWHEVARIFADGLYNTIVHWSPQCVVLGGSVMKDMPLQVVAEQLMERMHIFPQLPLLKRGELGDWCGIYGGIALAQILSN